jgi:hypothetical protein
VKFSSSQDFELQAHKCFDHIFELLLKLDTEIKKQAEKEETLGNYGVVSDMRDWVEEIILYSHLAWQYHRLTKGARSTTTWDRVENEKQNTGEQEG